MASVNPFVLLGDNDDGDPSRLVEAQQKKVAPPKALSEGKSPAKFPTKPLPPAQAVREAKSNASPARAGGRGSFGQSGDSREVNADGYSGGSGFSGAGEERDDRKPLERERGSYGGARQPYRGGRRGGYVNGEAHGDSDRPPRRLFERRSGTGHGTEIKREGFGRGNWGTPNDYVIAQDSEDVAVTEENAGNSEKQPEQEILASEANKGDKQGKENADPEKEEDKEMTLEEYEKIREEKRKALLSMKAEERKVEVDKELESMQQLPIKKGKDEIFFKLASQKDSKKLKDNSDRDEKAKKPVSINEFLKLAEGERYHAPGGRGRDRGRGDQGALRGDDGSFSGRAEEAV